MNPALAPAVAALEAERLAPVPRASRAVAVDVDDLALVLDHVSGHLSSELAEAYGRLEKTIRRHAWRT